MNRARLGIVVTHPIQYQVPLFRYLTAESSVDPLVFFLSDHGLAESFDKGFGRVVKYDVPLLGGYQHHLVPNRSPRPNVGTPCGVLNPSLPKLIKRAEIDALLVHGYSNISHWLAYATAVTSKIPYLLRGESRPRAAHGMKSLAKRTMLGALVRNADACLAIGRDNGRFYTSYGAQPNQIYLSPYSVDTERFTTAGESGRAHRTDMLKVLGLNPALPLVLFAAKLLPRKRPTDVVTAMDQLDDQANLLIIGDGPLRPDIETLVSKRPWIRTLGFVNQREIARWYGAADLFVLPSDHEPWGLAVNEAMAAGTVPIVSDSVGCAADLVTSDVGWVYATGDTAALAEVIAEGCKPGALTSRRPAAQRRATQYGIAATAHGIEAAVSAVLG